MGKGGRRPYAGRPVIIAGRKSRATVTLLVSTEAYLRRLGNGSLSVGIQKAVDKLTAGG